MRRVIINDTRHIYPFNEPARDLRVQNKPLWLHQRDLLAGLFAEEREYPDWALATLVEGAEMVEALAHRDNIYFNRDLVDEFVARARVGKEPVRLAFHRDDPAVRQHMLPLAHNFDRRGPLVLAEMWYLPQGVGQVDVARPLIIETEAREIGYYHVPPYMATDTGDLVYQLPRKAFVSLESWIHVFIVDVLFGVFARGVLTEERVSTDWRTKLKILLSAIWEQKHVLDTSTVVRVGSNCSIDPSAVIHGMTTIGNNVTIGPGAVIDNCIIGDNVNVSQGCQLMLSVVGDGCFLPFRSSLFMTTLMERSMVAQNTCLQLCVIGRDSFVGAGTTFTDFNVVPAPLRATGPLGLEETGMIVLGGCVGHHCRLSSGLTLMPARTVESDVVLLARDERSFIDRDVRYEHSDHHTFRGRYAYPRLYPRQEPEHGLVQAEPLAAAVR